MIESGETREFSRRERRWAGRDSNPHPLRDQVLNLACLPFHHPPLGEISALSGEILSPKLATPG